MGNTSARPRYKPSSPPEWPAAVSELGRQGESSLEAICRRVSPWTWSIWILLQLAVLFELVHGQRASPVPTLRIWIASAGFIALKAMMVLTAIVPLLWKLPIMSQRYFPPRYRIKKNEPLVDVLICCCGEDCEVTLNTIKAVCEVDYPRSLVRIFVGDDGNSEDLRGGIRELQEQYSGLFYHCRRKQGAAHGGKAGNINSCIAYAKSLEGPQAEYFAVLDCDMIPDVDWLRATIAAATSNSHIGLIDCDQGFYNLPIDDPLTQRRGSRLDESCRNCLHAADCGGTGFVVRMSAYDDLGGFPQMSVAEDILFSHLLHRKGWKTLSLGETLQRGTMPEDLAGHVAQRRKWLVGHTQNAIILGFGADLRVQSQLSLLQRLEVVAYSTGSILYCVVLPFCYALVPVFVLVGGDRLIRTPSETAFRQILVTHFVERLAAVIAQLVEAPLSGFKEQRSQRHGTRWLLPTFCFDILAVIFPIRSRALPNFAATGCMRSHLHERDAILCAPLGRRLSSVTLRDPFLLNSMILSVAAICFFASTWNVFSEQPVNSESTSFLERAVHGPLFPWIGWDEYASFMIPIWYMAFPPTKRNWKALLQKDHNDVWRPRRESMRNSWSASSAMIDVPYVLALAWALVACKC